MLGAAALAERLKAIEESVDPISSVGDERLEDMVDATIEQLLAKLGQPRDREIRRQSPASGPTAH
jgi:hypothetical protein